MCDRSHPARPLRLAAALAATAVLACAAAASDVKPDRQFQNIVFRVPDGHWAVQIQDQGVLIVDAAEARRGRFDGYMTISASRAIDRELRRMPMVELCRSLGLEMIRRQLGEDARFNEFRVVAEAAREGYDLCQVAAVGQAQDGSRRPKSVAYTITRSGDRVATLDLHAFGDEKALQPRVKAYDALLAGADFVNRLGKPLASPQPLPRDLAVYLSPPPADSGGSRAAAPTPPAGRGRNCRMVSSQQCMSQMLGAFPNMSVSYSCLPVQQEVCS